MVKSLEKRTFYPLTHITCQYFFWNGWPMCPSPYHGEIFKNRILGRFYAGIHRCSYESSSHIESRRHPFLYISHHLSFTFFPLLQCFLSHGGEDMQVPRKTGFDVFFSNNLQNYLDKTVIHECIKQFTFLTLRI